MRRVGKLTHLFCHGSGYFHVWVVWVAVGGVTSPIWGCCCAVYHGATRGIRFGISVGVSRHREL